MRFRPRRRVVHAQLEIWDEVGRTLARVTYEDDVCVYITMPLSWPMGDGEKIVMSADGLRVAVRAWMGPEGWDPPMGKSFARERGHAGT